MTQKQILYDRPDGFKSTFDLVAGANKKSTHYCPGCGHGILHKLVAEAIADFGIKDRTVVISPVGCAVFAYYYFDCFGISVPHGRAPAVGTGLARANERNVVISYQGDGDLGAIGLAEIVHAANRGENMCVLFVNNSVYGMTGGQMAPTTLAGQKTPTSPAGRQAANDGSPIRIAEIIAGLTAPVYVERVALSTPAAIARSRAALRKALKNTIERKGFSFVEFLAGCPIGLKLNPVEINDHIDQVMAGYFPLGKLKEVESLLPKFEPQADTSIQTAAETDESDVFTGVFKRKYRIKIAGSGGQGVLALGAILAAMGKLSGCQVTFLPAYGPEMRGGTANCSVIISPDEITSPVVGDNIDILIALNELSLERYRGSIASCGIMLVNDPDLNIPPAPGLTALNGAKFADLKSVNIVMLGALVKALNLPKLPELAALAVADYFDNKPEQKIRNLAALQSGINRRPLRPAARPDCTDSLRRSDRAM